MAEQDFPCENKIVETHFPRSPLHTQRTPRAAEKAANCLESSTVAQLLVGCLSSHMLRSDREEPVYKISAGIDSE